MTELLLDTGPLVALLDGRDQYHSWAKEQLRPVDGPLLTCEAVLAETHFLLRHLRAAQEAVLDMMSDGLIQAAFRLQEESKNVSQLFKRYSNVPMSMADACLVRMAELYPGSSVLTLDSDFRIYRMQGRQVVSTIIPVSRRTEE